MRIGSYVPGRPPEGMAEQRTFGGPLCARAMNCDFCRHSPHSSCEHWPRLRERALSQAEVPQCPEYKRRGD